VSESTLQHHVTRFLGLKYNRSTRGWYDKNLRPLVAFYGGGRLVTSVDRLEAEAYLHALQSKKTCWESHPHRPTVGRSLSPTTLNNHLRAARTFWTEMVRQRVVEYNPFDHLRPIKDDRPVVMKAITAEDLRAIWNEAKGSNRRDLAIITVLGTTGVRAGELVSMEIARLDLKKGGSWVHGKRGWRKLVLGAMGVQVIKSYLAKRPPASTDRLWLNTTGNPLTTDGIRQIVDRLADKADVTGRHNLHSFRHRTAQAWLDNGINAEIVAQLLGHSDVSTTLRIYANQDERHLRAAMRAVEFSPFEDSEALEESALVDVLDLLGED
jgi:integrase/recombinase XerC